MCVSDPSFAGAVTCIFGPMVGPSSERNDSPESVFALAQNAMAVGDWESFFPCLDAADLRRIAAMVLPLACATDSHRFAAICRDHGVTEERLQDIRTAQIEISESAAAIIDPFTPSSPDDGSRASLNHRDLVRAHDAAVVAAVREVADLAGFVAASERFRRETSGGGSVSSSLFLDEKIVDIVVSGRSARATRRRRVGGDDPVAFVLRRDGWRIRLFAGRLT
jgi:hypothetical protein